MNMISSRSLLLCIILCISGSLIAFSGTNPDRSTTSNKELIIVNVDESLSSSMEDLAKYVYNLAYGENVSKITIKRYIESSDEQSKQTISGLISLLIDQGIASDYIVVSDEPLTLQQPYFTVAVSEVPKVQ